MLLKLGMQHQELKFYKVFYYMYYYYYFYYFYINDDLGLTLTYFTARSNWDAYTFEWGNLKLFNGEKLQQRTKLTE